MQKNKRIYLDYAATTPLDQSVLKAMSPYFFDCFGNPSSTHLHGQRASAAVFQARQTIAHAIGADYQEIIFTGSATEANNLALQGIMKKALSDAKNANTRELREYNHSQNSHGLALSSHRLRIIISAIEHESVMEPCIMLEKEYGVEVVRIPVGHDGIIDLQKLKAALNERTVLVSVQYANSEIGVAQPIAEISRIIRDFREQGAKRPPTPPQNGGFVWASTAYGARDDVRFALGALPLFHTDAAQTFQFLPCDVHDLGVDMLTLSAHKIYGPKGVGVLYIKQSAKRKAHIAPLIIGGGQEQGMRAGTENVAAIVGFGAAVALVEKFKVSEFKRIKFLLNYFWRELKKIAPDAEINGGSTSQLPHILNIYFPGRPSQDLCIELDLLGIAVSPGTACSSRVAEPSYVIKALGFSADRASSSIRFSFGRPTTKAEIDAALIILKKRFD